MAGRTTGVVALLGRLVFALGVLFVGWGLDDLSGFFAHPARAALIGWVLLGTAWALGWRLDLQIFRKGKRPVGRQRWLLAALLAIGLFFVWWLPYADRRSLLTFAGADPLRYVGLGLAVAGDTVALVALRTLGKQYSGYVTLQEEHQLVQTGIYRVIRHPIYLRGLLTSIGLPLVFRSWLLFTFLAFTLVFVALRIRQEEKLLAEHFGAAFDAYRQRTWRLLPYLY
ncbi:MAG: methyltransferase family protein [Terriglobia bacterium]